MFDRRSFLKSSGLMAWSASAPVFLAKTAWAAGDASNAGVKDSILVMVQLTGGNDGLNTVIPFADPLYAKYRPTIKIAKDQVKKVDDNIGLHPSLDGFAKLLEKQALCIVQGVGYPNPSQSHFRSMDIWQAANTAETLTEGWLGKALKHKSAPAFHIAGPNESAPLALAGAPMRAPSITSLEDFRLKLAATSRSETKMQKSIIESSADPSPPTDDLLDFVKRTATNTYASSERLQEIGKNYQPKLTYPKTGLANRLKLAAQLIDADLGARIFYVSIDGFDTHSGQGGIQGAHANLLREVGDAIHAFYTDLAARGHGDRLMIATYSEFGRRAKENGSRGTDHGSGAPMFLVGGRIRPGVIGDHPSLENLEQGNLQHSIDFRSVYAGILNQWLGLKANDVINGQVESMEILKRI